MPVLEPAVVGELPPYFPLEIGVLVAFAPPLFEQPALRMRCPRLVEKDLGWAEQRKVIGETGHRLEGYFGARGDVKRGTGEGGGIEYVPMFAAEFCGVVNDIKPAAQIVKDLVHDAEATLAGAPTA